MAQKEYDFKCLNCGREYRALYDIKNVTERTCPRMNKGNANSKKQCIWKEYRNAFKKYYGSQA